MKAIYHLSSIITYVGRQFHFAYNFFLLPEQCKDVNLPTINLAACTVMGGVWGWGGRGEGGYH